MNVQLIGMPHICAPGKYFGILFEALGKPKLSEDKKSFSGVVLIAEGVNEKDTGVKSLVTAGKLESLTDKDVKALREKYAEDEF